MQDGSGVIGGVPALTLPFVSSMDHRGFNQCPLTLVKEPCGFTQKYQEALLAEGRFPKTDVSRRVRK